MSGARGYERRARKRRYSSPPVHTSTFGDSSDEPTTLPLLTTSFQITDDVISSASKYVEMLGSPKKKARTTGRKTYHDSHHDEFPNQQPWDPVLDSLNIQPPEEEVLESDDDEEHSRYLQEEQGKTRVRGPSALLSWILDKDEQNLFLREFIRLEGRGDPEYRQECADCGVPDPSYRCEDCFGPHMLCKPCIVKDHKRNPFHRVQKWNGLHFERTTLTALGLSIQLSNHPAGQECSNPEKSPWGLFAVIDTTGIHELDLNFCGCNLAPAGGHVQQLLRWRLLPSTSVKPRTAATFKCLKLHQLMAFEGKLSMFAFYYTLARYTDNTIPTLMKFKETEPPLSSDGGDTPSADGPQPRAVELDLYSSFRTVVRKYQFVKMLMRAGRGQDGLGVEGTQPGSLALQCPACPSPGVNLPADWLSSPPEKRWLYKVFLAMDGNFRLISDKVSSNTADPALTDGLAYMVHHEHFQSYLDNYKYKDSKNTNCVSHKAVRDANTKPKESGLRATGVGSVDCSRHEMKRPLASGDFQLGERYRNMDYFFWSSIKSLPTGTSFCVSYDIACQWSVHLLERLVKAMPEELRPLGDFILEFLIPKFHLPTHVERCRLLYSYFFTEYTGRTDGEAPERLWRYLDAIASLLRGMGPGGRADRLNDFIGDWNWKKTVNMVQTLERKLIAAIPEVQKHVEALERYEDIMQPEHVESWKEMLQGWQADKSRPNPFESKTKPFSEQAVRLQLLKEEEELLNKDKSIMLHEEVTPLAFLTAGLELSVAQLRLKADIKKVKDGATYLQQSAITQAAISLRKQFNTWVEYQTLYCPSAIKLRSDDESRRKQGSTWIPIEEVPLLLPSDIPKTATCSRNLQEMEWKVRQARLLDSLHKIRTTLAYKAAIWKHKHRFSRGQKVNVRSHDAIQLAESKIAFFQLLYNTDRVAMIKLQPLLGYNPTWQSTFQYMSDKDREGLSEDQAAENGVARRSEGRSTLSWIWTVNGLAEDVGGDEDASESLRIEWCKLRMRAHGWACEIQLLLEEMRRVVATFNHREQLWDSRAKGWKKLSVEEGEGVVAFAKKQSSMWRAFASAGQQVFERSQSRAEKEGRVIDYSRPVGMRLNDDGFEGTAN